MKRGWPLCLLIGFLSWSCLAFAADKCEGKPQGHNLPHYEFQTFSRVYQDGQSHYFETCVLNLTNKVLEFKWYVPGPHTWVRPGKAWPHPRERWVADRTPGEPGCLRYGALWADTKASYVAPLDDAEELMEERRLGSCRARVLQEGRQADVSSQPKSPPNAAEKLLGITRKIEVMAPVDRKRPDETMIHLQAEVTLKPDGNNFFHSFRYHAKPLNPDTFKADITDMIMVPESPLVRAIYEKNADRPKGVVRLSYKDEVVPARFPLPSHATLGEVRYVVFDTANQPVATLYVPFFVGRQ